MRIESSLQRLEVYVVSAVAVVLVSALAFSLSGPSSAPDYDLTDVSPTTSEHSSKSKSDASYDYQPALLEPALRSLDGVAYHG